jgi:uncharacterized protein (UPF0335 family)
MQQEDEPVMSIVTDADKDDKNTRLVDERLRSLIERIERLEEEKAELASDIKDIYAEAKGAGFDPKIMRMVIKLRKQSAADRDEQDFLLDEYKRIMGL